MIQPEKSTGAVFRKMLQGRLGTEICKAGIYFSQKEMPASPHRTGCFHRYTAGLESHCCEYHADMPHGSYWTRTGRMDEVLFFLKYNIGAVRDDVIKHCIMKHCIFIKHI